MMQAGRSAVIVVVSLLAACGTVGDKMSSYEPSITNLANNQYQIHFYVKTTDEAAIKLKETATKTCNGRSYSTDDYKTQDYRPVYISVDARISCK